MKILILISLVGVLFSGCGKDSSGGSTASELEGTWNQACVGSGGQSSQLSIVFSGDSYTVTAKAYLFDASCTSLSFTQVINGKAAIGEAAASPANAKKLNLTLNTFAITPNSAGTATGLNGVSYCGITTWALNSAQDVTGKTCGSAVYTSGKGDFNIYVLSGTALNLGDESGANDGTTDGKRPTSVETAQYTKQ